MLLSAVWSVDHISMLLAFCNQSCLPKLSVSVDMFCWQLLCSVRVCLCCHAWNDHIWFENMTCSTFLHCQWFVLKQMQPLWLVCCHWRVMLSKAFSSLLRCLASLFVDSSCALVAQIYSHYPCCHHLVCLSCSCFSFPFVQIDATLLLQCLFFRCVLLSALERVFWFWEENQFIFNPI